MSPRGEPLPAEGAPATAQPGPTAPGPAVRPPGASGVPASSAGPLTLRDGATLALPPGATERRAPRGLPDVVRGAHNYTLPGGRQRLMVSELALEGQSCVARLDAEWARMQSERTDQDPARLELRRTTQIEQRMVAGRRVLYSESLQGTSLADAGGPFAAVASVFLCERGSLLLIMYMSDRAELAGEIRPMLDAMVASYRPPPASPP